VTIACHLKQDFAVVGSWQAHVMVKAVDNGMYEKMGADDIDVYFAKEGIYHKDHNDISVVFEETKYIKLDGIDREVNTVPVHNFSAEKVVTNNDVNTTAIGVEVIVVAGADDEVIDESDILIKPVVNAHFRELLLNEVPMFKPTKPAEAKSCTLVHLHGSQES
jgi:hypothetical protein